MRLDSSLRLPYQESFCQCGWSGIPPSTTQLILALLCHQRCIGMAENEIALHLLWSFSFVDCLFQRGEGCFGAWRLPMDHDPALCLSRWQLPGEHLRLSVISTKPWPKWFSAHALLQWCHCYFRHWPRLYQSHKLQCSGFLVPGDGLLCGWGSANTTQQVRGQATWGHGQVLCCRDGSCRSLNPPTALCAQVNGECVKEREIHRTVKKQISCL